MRKISSQIPGYEAGISLHWHCANCDLIFKDQAMHLDWQRQKNRYDLHNNSSQDPAYVAYFQRFLVPALIEIKKRNINRGLDWGSGPQPVLKELLAQCEIQMDTYDPIYSSDKTKLSAKYPMVTCTEVIEHFTEPDSSFQQIDQFLDSGSLFCGSTEFHQGAEHYSNWWYARDPTHFCFFSGKTFLFLADKFSWKVICLQTPVFIFEKIN